MRALFFFFLATISAIAAQKHYDGYQVFEVNAKDKVSLEVLTKLQNERSDVYDFWTEPRNANRPIDIMVPPAFIKNFVDLMQAFDIDYKVKIADVERIIEANRKERDSVVRKKLRSRSGAPRYSLNWESYSDLPVLLYIPNLMTTSVVGQSYEGNNMNLVKISTGGSGKKAIFIDGGFHAREWISPSFVTWVIRELVENYAAHPQYVDNIDWYIMPVVNPDGYRYTFAANGDRLWRKNRRPNDGSACIGTGKYISISKGFAKRVR
ncbi:carboxypeptidase A4-like [Daphnia magna]|uniref:carboxypeptidase A4-like n=1 Tax=Daphnia magna TaxID=35525 RepID=UPI001E1BD7E7|nr:carboxypeptidase A4-like [Daphnia magna]